ncbi:alpha/beta hydrolase [Kitasatospora sp. NPDC101183]|uniref:alpha/beta hydrolase n=1 Tax=Kitasatospora sp. NPDC101183 TaxID=3364100 RepID=UPI003818E967
MTIVPVPFDPELRRVLAAMPAPEGPAPTLGTIPHMRGAGDPLPTRPPAEVIGTRPIDVEEHTAPGPEGAPDLALTVLRPRGARGPLPVLYNVHGGGMITGTRHQDTPRLADLVEALGVVAVTVEYRLAPEHPYPAQAEDCYAGFLWTAARAAELGIDPDGIVLMGGSAGGGLSAAVALMARDRGGPRAAGQLLICPMLDDTGTTVSSHQYDGAGTWQRAINQLAWRAVLGDRTDVPAYAAPARAGDLSGLPPAFVEVGSAELFRDEDVAYASRIWAAGGEAELHVWNGAFHGFDVFAPDHEVTRAALAARLSWLRRILHL